LLTSEDLPALGGVYKLSAVFHEDGSITPKIKLSDNTEKITNPAFKNLYRLYDKESGMAIADLITLRQETVDDSKPLTIFHPIETWRTHEVENFRAEPLLHTIVRAGKLVYEFPKLTDIRAFSATQLSKFWEEYLRLDLPQVYKVDLSKKLHALKIDMISDIHSRAKKEKKNEK
jgi:nicotinate phosphoribosyltransferase